MLSIKGTDFQKRISVYNVQVFISITINLLSPFKVFYDK